MTIFNLCRLLNYLDQNYLINKLVKKKIYISCGVKKKQNEKLYILKDFYMANDNRKQF